MEQSVGSGVPYLELTYERRTMISISTAPSVKMGFAAAFLALTVLTGCGAEAEDIAQTQSAITGGWVNLDLINGWTNANGTSNPPAIGIVNGVVTFRGAIKATNPTSNVAFSLGASKYSGFRTNVLNAVYVAAAMSGNTAGTLFYNPFLGGNHAVAVMENGVASNQVGTNAKAFTSLDGAAFDRVVGSPINYDTEVWTSQYGFRQSINCSGCGVYGKQVDGFARFQGLLTKLDANDTSGYLFTLTDPQLIPGNNVTVPLHLGQQGSNMSFGALTFYPSGDVYVNGQPFGANSGTSFEGVWFSKTLAGNVALPLNTAGGWHAHSSRSVKVGKYGDVVRFQGAISGGSSTTIATLPAGYAPTKQVKLRGVASGPVPVTIVVNTNSTITFEGVPTTVASSFLSLDGVSYGL